MSEFKSLETKIREMQRDATLKRIQEAVAKREKVTAAIIEPKVEIKTLTEHLCFSATGTRCDICFGPTVDAELTEEEFNALSETEKGMRGPGYAEYIKGRREKNKDARKYGYKNDKERNPEDHEKKEESVSEDQNPQQSQFKQKQQAVKTQIEKQKEEIRMQLMQQKATKQEQAMKQKAEQQLQKVKEEEELEEGGFGYKVRGFRAARRLEQLHSRRMNMLNRSGDHKRAEIHRMRSQELKRVMYAARDNPERSGIG